MAGGPGTARWSRPTVLSACAASAAPRVVFPSDSPNQGTGTGAIVWSAASACPGGGGARVAAVGSGGVAAAGGVPRTSAGRPLAVGEPLQSSGGPYGQIVIAGASPSSRADGLLIEGPAGGPFSKSAEVHVSAAQLALATAYLGDVALACAPAAGSAGDGGGLRVFVQRHYAHGFAAGVRVTTGGGPVRAPAVALDYRSDVLAVWAQDGAIYARELPATGPPHPIQRLARVGSHVQIAALLSDDGRAIVAWSEQQRGQTAVYLDHSGAGVRFGSPILLERFRDPVGVAPPASSPLLVRLSSESVMMAWAGSAAGRWVVRVAAVDRSGTPAVATVAASGDALLEDLAPGPDGDAIVLWSEPQQAAGGSPRPDGRAIFAARGIDAYPGRAIFGRPEQAAPLGPNRDAAVALDPDSDRAIAAWIGAGGRIEYAIRYLLAGS
jgi:hypothetical protein